MSERPPRRRRPKGFDDIPQLTDAEVESRIGAREWAAQRRDPLPPVPPRPTRRRPQRRRGRTVASDSLLVLGLLVVGLVALRFMLPSDQSGVAATNGPGASQAAIGSVAARTLAPGETLAPGQTLGPAVDPSLDLTATPTIEPTAAPSGAASTGPTARPTPAPTLRPGQTPHPTGTPKPSPTAGPTAPNTAKVKVIMHVVNNSGGAASANDWTMKLTGEVGSAVSPNNFAGSEIGTTVTIPAGKGYLVTDNLAVAAYGPPQASADCNHPGGGGGLAPGASVTCTITRNDKPRVRVETHVVNDDSGTASAGDWAVTVTGAGATPSSFAGTESGRIVIVDPGGAYSVAMVGPSGYAESASGGCSGSLGIDAALDTCTITYNDDAPGPTGVIPIVVLPLALPFALPRRWRAIRTR